MRSTLSRLSKIAFPLALALPAGWLALDRPDAAAAAARERFAASPTQLQLAGAAIGTLRSAAGGTAVASIATDALGPGAPPKKHVIGVGYEPIELELDFSLERPIYDWIGAAWAGSAPRKSGSLVSVDLNGNARATRDFKDALITETTIPACDAAGREPGFLSLVIAPERVSVGAGSGGKGPAPLGTRAKSWLTSSFKLEIDGLDTTRVVRIEPLHFQQAGAGASAGALREQTREPAAIQFDNLRITLAEAGSESWRAWHEDFVIKGNASEAKERSGRLLLLGPNLKDEIARVEFANLGIVALRAHPASAGASQLEAELYVERMALSVGGK